MADLFDNGPIAADDAAPRPLADRLRPTDLSQVVGQEHLLADGPLGAMLDASALSSLILWGPPGTGKTTIARLLAARTALAFVAISAIDAGAADLRRAFAAAGMRRSNGRGTLLFVDEVHRFNKAQQDAFLPHMEDGTITLVGATTENPSFELNAAILSRAQVLVLRRLDEAALSSLLDRAEAEVGPLPLTPAARARMLAMADGDGRALLGMAERVLGAPEPLDLGGLARRTARRAAQYDKSGDAHYDLISALHKSVRGSDPDAALYWLARMLEGGEDPRYLARRLLRMAIEDVGLADPHAPAICIAAWEAYERLGSPEGEQALANAAVHLAVAPKSNAAYAAYKASRGLAARTGSLPPPDHIRGAPTALMRSLGRGADYEYDHDAEGGVSGQDYFPGGMDRPRLYAPLERGHEARILRRLEELDAIRARRAAGE